MATERIVTVAPSGGDYTTLQAAVSTESKDLVALDRVLIIEVEDFEDTTQVIITGYNTDATRYLHIRPATGHGVVGPMWDDTKYRLNYTGSGTALSIASGTGDIILERLQIRSTQHATSERRAIAVEASLTTGVLKFRGLVVRGINTGTETGQHHGIKMQDSSVDYELLNCTAIGFESSGFTANTSTADVWIYNCLAYNCAVGFQYSSAGANRWRIKNCGAVGCSDGFQGTGHTASSDFNSSDLSGDAPGANSIEATPTFVDAGGLDFHLDESDAAWRGAGTDLSADVSGVPFSTDAEGDTRSAWDIGPDEFVASGGGVSTVVVPHLLAHKRRHR